MPGKSSISSILMFVRLINIGLCFFYLQLDGEMIPLEVVLLEMLSGISGVSQMLEVYDLNGTWHIVMAGNPPHVQDLFDYICKLGYLNEHEAAFIMYQLIGILLQCHEAGVIHRDLKDENLLIDEDNQEIKLIDFGSGTFLHDNIYNDFDGNCRASHNFYRCSWF